MSYFIQKKKNDEENTALWMKPKISSLPPPLLCQLQEVLPFFWFSRYISYLGIKLTAKPSEVYFANYPPHVVPSYWLND